MLKDQFVSAHGAIIFSKTPETGHFVSILQEKIVHNDLSTTFFINHDSISQLEYKAIILKMRQASLDKVDRVIFK